MKCQDFENIVNDLARGQLIDAAAQREGLDHARDCQGCAARLSDERTLTLGLRAVAKSDETMGAPAEVETALLEAFRRRAWPAVSPPSPVSSEPWSRWTLAAAALVLLALGLIVYRTLGTGLPQQPLVGGSRPTPHPSSRIPEKNDRDPQVKPLIGQKDIGSAPPTVAVNAGNTGNAGNAGVGEKRFQKRAHRPPIGADVRRVVIRDGMTLYASDSEVTTDFLMLSSSGKLVPMDRGQVIRVQIPRSALVSFGLPMNAERSEQPVKADLLVGEDGLARAIRFVR